MNFNFDERTKVCNGVAYRYFSLNNHVSDIVFHTQFLTQLK